MFDLQGNKVELTRYPTRISPYSLFLSLPRRIIIIITTGETYLEFRW